MIYFYIVPCFMDFIIRALHWGETDVMWHWDGALDLGVNVNLSCSLGIE